jgi:hypothetical protein
MKEPFDEAMDGKEMVFSAVPSRVAEVPAVSRMGMVGGRMAMEDLRRQASEGLQHQGLLEENMDTEDLGRRID